MTLTILAAIWNWLAANKVLIAYVAVRDARFWTKVKGWRGLKNFWLTGSVSPDATPAPTKANEPTEIK